MRTGFARLNDREMLQKYGDKKGHFRLHYVTQTKIAHPYLLESFNGAYLFINVIDLEDGTQVARNIWLNKSVTINRLHLKPGDIIEGYWFGEMYKMGREYNALNTLRANEKTFRLLYPSDVVKVGWEELPKDKIIVLNNLRYNKGQAIFNSLEEYHATLKGCSDYNKELGLIHLYDTQYRSQLFTKKGKLRNTQYKPKLIFQSVYDSLTEREQMLLIDKSIKLNCKLEPLNSNQLKLVIPEHKSEIINRAKVYEEVLAIFGEYKKIGYQLVVTNIDYYIKQSLK